jgi:hypothetical protein
MYDSSLFNFILSVRTSKVLTPVNLTGLNPGRADDALTLTDRAAHSVPTSQNVFSEPNTITRILHGYRHLLVKPFVLAAI